MRLSLWTYEGPPHIGAMRVAASMRGVHLVLHAPQGDTYADLLFTMIERRGSRPPVTYTTFQARDLGRDTADLFRAACAEAHDRFRPETMLVAASCTAELLQDDPAGLAEALRLPVPVVPLELPSYSRKEGWGADETFYRIVRALCAPAQAGAQSSERHAGDSRLPPTREHKASANILGPTALGFRHRDDVREIRALLERMGVAVNAVAPLGASPDDIRRLPDAGFNILLYPETGDAAARWLEREYGQAIVRTVPIGHGATARFVEEVAALAGVDPAPGMEGSNLPWWSRSVDSTYLTGKRVFIFGDATHAVAAARVARDELGFEVAGLGCYNREFARPLRDAAELYGVDPLVTDDHLEVEEAIERLQPELVLGTQMERHVAKRLRIPCAVISAPVHVQDFPARRSPQMGWEGANVLFDTWVHPLTMGLEEHLLAMFRDDWEFSDAAGPSHLSPLPRAGGVGGGTVASEQAHVITSPLPVPPEGSRESTTFAGSPSGRGEWHPDAERELLKVPFFVRGKARRNTEAFAAERGVGLITVDTLYEAKAHHAR